MCPCRSHQASIKTVNGSSSGESFLLCKFSNSPLFFCSRILPIVFMPGIACASIPPVSLCPTVCALTIPLAAAAVQKEAAAGQTVENGALEILIIKACVRGWRNIRCQPTEGIPANVKDVDHSNPSPVSSNCPLFSPWTGTSAPRQTFSGHGFSS